MVRVCLQGSLHCLLSFCVVAQCQEHQARLDQAEQPSGLQLNSSAVSLYTEHNQVWECTNITVFWGEVPFSRVKKRKVCAFQQP